MSWSISKARALGLKPISDLWAYDPNRVWRVKGIEVVIDLRNQKLAADARNLEETFDALGTPTFNTLEECLVYLRLHQ